MTTDKLTELCMSFPGVTQGVKWEDHLCFMVGEKMFVITGFPDDSTVSIKASDEDFEELCERRDIIPAPYMARNKWVQLQKRSAFKPKEWGHYLRQAYELIKAKLPKKVQREIDGN